MKILARHWQPIKLDHDFGQFLMSRHFRSYLYRQYLWGMKTVLSDYSTPWFYPSESTGIAWYASAFHLRQAPGRAVGPIIPKLEFTIAALSFDQHARCFATPSSCGSDPEKRLSSHGLCFWRLGSKKNSRQCAAGSQLTSSGSDTA